VTGGSGSEETWGSGGLWRGPTLTASFHKPVWVVLLQYPLLASLVFSNVPYQSVKSTDVETAAYRVSVVLVRWLLVDVCPYKRFSWKILILCVSVCKPMMLLILGPFYFSSMVKISLFIIWLMVIVVKLKTCLSFYICCFALLFFID
jgi:hypothetical protein